jgi:hypothetical protein
VAAHGSDEQRVTALGMMQARPELREIRAVLPVIEDPRSPFEQYHALRLADEMVNDLGTVERRLLAQAVKDQQGLGIRRDASRWHLCKQILRGLNEDGNAG